MTRDRAALVEAARTSIVRGSKSFAMASRLFDHPTRERAWLLYSWCRACDDLADGQDHGGIMSAVADPFVRLASLSERTEAALRGEQCGDPPFDALAVIMSECAIPPAWPRDLIKGFAMDAEAFSPRTTQDLLSYCYHVAGVVGLMMAVVMGVDPDDEGTLRHANDLGIAFQLANIARDIGEDAAAGRCYVPATWLGNADIPPGEHMRPHHRKTLAALARRMADMASGYEASAREGARRLPFRSRWAVLAAAGIYGDIAREVARRGTKAWDHRVTTSSRDKLGWVIRAFAAALLSGRRD